MSKEFLTNKVWHDPEGTTYIMLDVTSEIEPPQAITVDGVELLPKDEYHVTLVPTRKLTDDTALQQAIVESVRAHLQGATEELKFMGVGDERYLCRDGEEATLIAPANIVGLNGVRRVVTNLVPDYEPAFPHVTLLKNAVSKYGIGINSEEDLRRLCRKLD